MLRGRKSFVWSLYIVFCIYVLYAVSGYVIYGEQTLPYTLDNFKDETALSYMIINICTIVNVAGTFPLFFFVLRNNMILFVDDLMPKSRTKIQPSEKEPEKEVNEEMI